MTRPGARRTRNFTFIRIMHSFFAALTVGTFGLLLWRTFDLVLLSNQWPSPAPLWLVMGFTLLAAGLEILFTLLSPGQRLDPAFRWRALFVFLIAGYLTVSLIHPVPWTIKFLPRLNSLTFLAYTLFIFYTMGATHQPLLHREELTLLFEGKRGDVLLEMLQHEHPQILAALTGIRKNNNRCILMIISTIFLIMILWSLGVDLSASKGLTILTLGSLTGSFLGLSLGNSYLDDHRSLLKTSLYSLDQRVSRLMLSLIIIVLALALGWSINSSRAVLPPEVVIALFAWLAGLFTPRGGEQMIQEMEQLFRPEPARIPLVDMDAAERAFDLSKYLAFIGEVLRNGLIIAAVLGLMFFLVYPALKKGAVRNWFRTIGERMNQGSFKRFLLSTMRIFRSLGRLWTDLFRRRDTNWNQQELSKEALINHYLRDLVQFNKRAQGHMGPLQKALDRLFTQLTRFHVPLSRDATLRELVFQGSHNHPAAGITDSANILCTCFEQILYDPSLNQKEASALLETISGILGTWESLNLD